AQPEKLDHSYNSNQNKQTFFKHFSQVENILNDIQDNLTNMNKLYNELGEGKINDELTIQKRNEIIQSLTKYQNDIKILTNNLNQNINQDVAVVKGLKAIKSTSPNAFDKLLKNQKQKKLSSKELSFQRRS
ncbi:hypothetical protein, partial [Mycobacterium marinum]